MKLIIHHPLIITARLLPGFQVGGGFVSLDLEDISFHIDLPDGTSHHVTDYSPGLGASDRPDLMLADLISFLTSGSEGLFPEPVQEWADANEDDLTLVQYEIEESETPRIEIHG